MSSKITQNVNSVVATVISVSFNIIIIAVVVMCVYSFGSKAYQFGNAIFDASPVDSVNVRTVTVTVPDGASVTDIAGIMESAGLVNDKYVFAVQLILSDEKDMIKSGTYSLSTDMLPSELINAMIPQTEEEAQQ